MNKKIFLKNKKSKNHSQTVLDNEAIRLFKDSRSQHLIIIVLFRDKKLPRYCAPMLRKPNPKIDIPLNDNLAEMYFSAIKKNPSIEDGVKNYGIVVTNLKKQYGNKYSNYGTSRCRENNFS